MDNPIATFLSLAVPWAEAGYIGIFGPYTPPDLPAGAKPPMSGQAFKDLNAAMRYVYASRQYRDLYVCMSLQSQAEPKMNRHGRRYLRARKHKEHALLLRSLWLDVDIKHGFFRNTQHALEVFGEWRRAVGLPPPTFIVLTGSGGFHAHWIFDKAIDVETWQPLADALANAADSLKPLPGPDGEERRLDLGLTTDAARIMRIPNTFNFKHDPPQMVVLGHAGETYPLEVIDKALTPYKGSYGPAKLTPKSTLKPSPVFKGMVTPASLTAGMDDRWRPTAREVADVCPWFARVLHTRGVGCSEPEWFESLQVAYFCQLANELAHDLSDEHATYTKEETDRKFALVEDSHKTDRLGWPQCKTIHLNGAPECRICPHLSEGKSPFNFISTAPAESPIPVAARTEKQQTDVTGYWQDPETGIVYKLGKGDDEERKPICLLPILNVRTEAQRDDGSGRFAIAFDTYIDALRFKTVIVSYDELGELRLFVRCLGRYGVMIGSTELLRRYLISFTEQLRLRKQASVDSEPYGWSKIDSKRSAFVYNKRYNCAGTTDIMPLDAEMASLYRPMGTLESWKYNAALIASQQRYDLIALMVTGIAGPLVDIAGVDGVVVHAYGEPGIGKSHSMRVSQCTWARPVKAGQALRDTANAVEGRLGKLRNLPLFFDEIKGEENMKKIVEIIFLATQGKTKARMAPTSELKEVFEFCTLLAVASNNSLIDFINTHMPTSTAGLIRVFEIHVKPNMTGTGLISSTVAQRAMGDLRENYGHPGVLCADFFGKNIENLERAVVSAHDGFNDIVKGTHDERYWVAAMAVISVAARIGNKLGLFDVDINKLAEFLLSNFYRLRGIVSEASSNLTKPESVLGYIEQYINSHQRFMLVTDHTPSSKGRITKDSINVLSASNVDYKDGVRIRYAFADKLVRISETDFRQWLKTVHRIGPHEIMEAVKATLPVKFPRVILTAGTGLKGQASERSIELDLTHYPDLIKYERDQ